MIDERFIAPSYEEPVTLDDEPDVAWHQWPRCEACHGTGELYMPALGYGVGESWSACRACEGTGYVDPRSQT